MVGLLVRFFRFLARDDMRDVAPHCWHICSAERPARRTPEFSASVQDHILLSKLPARLSRRHCQAASDLIVSGHILGGVCFPFRDPNDTQRMH